MENQLETSNSSLHTCLCIYGLENNKTQKFVTYAKVGCKNSFPSCG